MDYAADRWFPVTPPGWPAILALGAYVGLAWLVNPILAGLNVILVYVFLRELFPRNVSRVSVFLLAFSPWYIFLGMSFMTHMSSLTFALLAAIGVARSRRSGKVSWALAAGLAIGIISLIRPLEAVAIAGLLGLWAIGLGGRRLKAGATAALILGTLATGSLGLAYNAAVGGSAFRFPINKYTDEHFGKNSNAYGFGPDRGMGWELDPNPGHGPLDALINSNLNASALNTELFGWPIGSFLLAAIGLCIARLDRGDYLMLAVIAAIYFLHFFYYFSGGPDFGARYWFLMIVPLVVLSARGMYKLAASLEGRFEGASARVFATVIAMCAITLLLFVPWRAVDKYRGFRGMSPEIGALARSHGFGSGLVLVQGKMDPDYAAAAVLNPLDLGRDATIYAWDRDPETRSALLAAYPGRAVWIVKGPSLTARGYEIVDGPLSAIEAERSIEPAN
jgi:4-amino-4-deoxy-L-arabinose transferase-like glycosyltransferase